MGGHFTYTYDTFGRLIKLNDNGEYHHDRVKDVVYDHAGRLTQARWRDLGLFRETRACNVRGQLSRLTTPGYDLEYRCSATQNNENSGRIWQVKDFRDRRNAQTSLCFRPYGLPRP